MNIVRLTRDGLADYTLRQLDHFLPDGCPIDREQLTANMTEALGRMEKCVKYVRAWDQDTFDHLQSSQYCTYLYFLANTIWRNTGETELPTRLFLLNKALNSIDLFYEIEMPDVFFIGHSIGIVLAKATYGEFLVLYQNSTVGKNHGIAPVIGEGVVLYPHTSIVGQCRIGNGTLVSVGTNVLNHDTPGNCVVYTGPGGTLEFRPSSRNVLADLFRL